MTTSGISLAVCSDVRAGNVKILYAVLLTVLDR